MTEVGRCSVKFAWKSCNILIMFTSFLGVTACRSLFRHPITPYFIFFRMFLTSMFLNLLIVLYKNLWCFKNLNFVKLDLFPQCPEKWFFFRSYFNNCDRNKHLHAEAKLKNEWLNIATLFYRCSLIKVKYGC